MLAAPSTEPLVRMPQAPSARANLVGGVERMPQASSARIDGVSPYTGKLLGSVPDTGASDVADAVSCASAAARGWAAASLKERTQPLFRFRELVLEQLEALSHMAASESGKTVSEARAGL